MPSQKGGLMGYPNPEESPYDLFMTGHAGCSVSTVLGMKAADDLLRSDDGRKSVAVLGDGEGGARVARRGALLGDDGGDGGAGSLPGPALEGLEDVSTYPALTAELLRRGYSDGDVKQILGLNMLRVMKKAEGVAWPR